MEERCSNCFYPLDVQNHAFVLCECCEQAKLCTRCSVLEEWAVCLECKHIETNAANEAEVKKKKLGACILCQNVWNISHCKICDKIYCHKCEHSYLVHTCYKCITSNCNNSFIWTCCSRKLCDTCWKRHIITDCEEYLNYTCYKCNKKVLTFGPSDKKCPVMDCTLKYGCTNPKCNILSFWGPIGTYCQNHTSNKNCPGCKLPYPLDPLTGYGNVKILVLFGTTPWKREYCGACFQKIVALVECSCIILRRIKKPIGEKDGFPKVLMDMIVLYALNVLI